MTNYYQCTSCRKTSAQEDCKVTINDQLICPHCLEAVEFAFSARMADQPEPSLGYCDGCDELEDKAKAREGKTKPEMNWLKLWTWMMVLSACIGFWAVIACFVWRYYVS